MSERMIVPHFCTEAEEAQWWFDNRDQLGDDLARAMKDGTAGRGTAMKRVLLLRDGILPEPADIQNARLLADKKGISYEDYLRQLIHNALQHELTADGEHAEAA